MKGVMGKYVSALGHGTNFFEKRVGVGRTDVLVILLGKMYEGKDGGQKPCWVLLKGYWELIDASKSDRGTSCQNHLEETYPIT